MLKLLELFGGIGACSSALDRLGIDYEIVDYVEIDKYAVASYNAIHNTAFKPSDICNYDRDIQVDLIMHGSPCQDFSLAGRQAGGDIGSGTRSSLMYETIRIVNKLKPKYVIWENVKNLLSKKHIHNFNNYLKLMSEIGYNNYYQVLNAKDYGIPQNRERVYTISIRKDINKQFVYLEKQELKLKLKDMLEDVVDEKYYLSKRMIDFFYRNEEEQKAKGNGFRFGVSDGNVIAKAVTTRAGGRMDDNFIKIDTENALDTKYDNKRLNETIEKNIDKFSEGKVLNMDLYNRTINENLSQTITLPHHNTQRLFDGQRIRKLTPKECWRLMGFTDREFEKAEKVNSNTQLYKQAGNSIVVNVLVEIFKNLLGEYK